MDPHPSNILNIPVSVQSRQAWHNPFIEVGLGVEQVGNSLMGILRVTASTYEQPQHVWDRQRIPFGMTLFDATEVQGPYVNERLVARL
jgi:hypothetical protein